LDLDTASFGVVSAVAPADWSDLDNALGWERKRAFHVEVEVVGTQALR
jgi:hypothetical protein